MSQKVFAKVFIVVVGTKKATIAGSDVGTKSLRYGACLECSDVNVKLVGEELVTQASFFMTKGCRLGASGPSLSDCPKSRKTFHP